MCQTCDLIGGYCGNCDGSYWTAPTTTTTAPTTPTTTQKERHTKCLVLAEESDNMDDRRFWEAVASYALKN